MYRYCINNEISLLEAKELIKKNTRHYAKRQYTWFNNQLKVVWFEQDEDIFNKVINYANGLYSK